MLVPRPAGREGYGAVSVDALHRCGPRCLYLGRRIYRPRPSWSFSVVATPRGTPVRRRRRGQGRARTRQAAICRCSPAVAMVSSSLTKSVTSASGTRSARRARCCARPRGAVTGNYPPPKNVIPRMGRPAMAARGPAASKAGPFGPGPATGIRIIRGVAPFAIPGINRWYKTLVEVIALLVPPECRQRERLHDRRDHRNHRTVSVVCTQLAACADSRTPADFLRPWESRPCWSRPCGWCSSPPSSGS